MGTRAALRIIECTLKRADPEKVATTNGQYHAVQNKCYLNSFAYKVAPPRQRRPLNQRAMKPQNSMKWAGNDANAEREVFSDCSSAVLNISFLGE